MTLDTRIDALLSDNDIAVSMPDPLPGETELSIHAVRRNDRREQEIEGYRVNFVGTFMSLEQARDIRTKLEEWCVDAEVRINVLGITFDHTTSNSAVW